MMLTEAELAYLHRFCWEVFHQENGPDTTINRCPGHYNDLADLAATTDLARETIDAAYATDYQDPPPPEAPFPWESLDHLRERADEIRRLKSRAAPARAAAGSAPPSRGR